MNTITGGIMSIIMVAVAVFSLMSDETAKELLDTFRPYLSFLSLAIILMIGLSVLKVRICGL